MQTISFQDVKTPSSVQQTKLGTRAMTPDGREWVYVKDSGSAFSAGHVVVPAAVVALAAGTLTSSSDTQSRKVYVDYSTGGLTAGAYDEGYLYINTGTGIGQLAKIKSNSAGRFELYPADALTTSLGATSVGSVWTQHVVRSAVASTEIQNATGIAQAAFTASYFGWVLKKGIGIVIAGTTFVVGAGFTTGDDTVGQAIVATTAKGTYDEHSLGVCIVANTAADTATIVDVNI
jgi:hypothetical protein